MSDKPTNDALIERLRKYEKEARDTAENCEVVAAAFSDQMQALTDCSGHNVYAVRMAVDHWNSAKRERQLADDLAAVLARMAGPNEVVVPREPTEAMVAAGSSEFPRTFEENPDAYAGHVYEAMLAARPHQGSGRWLRRNERGAAIAGGGPAGVVMGPSQGGNDDAAA